MARLSEDDMVAVEAFIRTGRCVPGQSQAAVLALAGHRAQLQDDAAKFRAALNDLASEASDRHDPFSAWVRWTAKCALTGQPRDEYPSFHGEFTSEMEQIKEECLAAQREACQWKAESERLATDVTKLAAQYREILGLLSRQGEEKVGLKTQIEWLRSAVDGLAGALLVLTDCLDSFCGRPDPPNRRFDFMVGTSRQEAVDFGRAALARPAPNIAPAADAEVGAGEVKAEPFKAASADWLLRMAEAEGNGCTSVGGLVTDIAKMEVEAEPTPPLMAAHIVSLVGDGWFWHEILKAHPELTEHDIRAAFQWAVERGKFPGDTSPSPPPPDPTPPVAADRGVTDEDVERFIVGLERMAGLIEYRMTRRAAVFADTAVDRSDDVRTMILAGLVAFEAGRGKGEPA